MSRRYAKVDGRRVLVVVFQGEDGYVVRYTNSCSGCFEVGENMGGAHLYPFDAKHGCYIGAGCDECGYTGKRRNVFWMPLDMDAHQAKHYPPGDEVERVTR